MGTVPTVQRHRSDARTRSWRTIRQGALAAALVAAAGAAADAVQHSGTHDWTGVGVSVGTAALMAGLAYIERAFIDPRRGSRS